MLKITAIRKSSEVVFAGEYRELQRVVTRLSGEPPPPCYYCTAAQIWSCSKTGRECSVFTRYCSKLDV